MDINKSCIRVSTSSSLISKLLLLAVSVEDTTLFFICTAS